MSQADIVTNCETWTGYIKPNGYGQAHRARCGGEGEVVYAHRRAWEEKHGAIPDGAQIHHTCFNRACVNPEHLQLVTSTAEHRELHNAARKMCNSGRHPWSADNVYTAPGGGGRSCRLCRNECNRRYRERRKAAA